MVKITPYTDEHKDQTAKFVISILEDEFGYTGIDRPDLYDISNFYQKDPNSNFWLALLSNEIIGTVAIQNCGRKRRFIKRMYVKKDLRSKGVGQALMNTLVVFAKNTDYKTIFISTVEEFESARKFYKKNGFVEIRELPKDIKAPGDNVFLELSI